MNSKLFSQYSLPEKIRITQQSGTHVATRHFNQYQIHLYALNQMLVEVWYTRHLFWKQPVKVEEGRSFSELLDPYLDMINLRIDFD